MRIVVVNQFFWPDLAPTGQYLCDLSRHLTANGHEVTVICSGGSYAEPRADHADPPPVRIIRVPGTKFKRGAFSRLLSYSAFFLGALWYQLRVRRPDVVLTMTTPPLLSVSGAIVKILRGTRHFIWEMDLFPDVLVTVGALREKSLITRILGWIADATRRHSDGLIVLGPCMQARLIARGIPGDLIHVAENWADGHAILPGEERRSGPLSIFYSGNLGMAHDIDTIAGAIRHFRNDSRFEFTFAGGGVGRRQLEQLCAVEDIRNVRFPPLAEKAAMREHLAQADIGLVTERPECIGTVVPSKVYGLMAAGKPIFFIGPGQATPGLIIERFRCGWQTDPGNLARTVEILENLADNRQAVALYGRRARAAFEQNYDLPDGVARVAAVLGVGTPDTSPVWAAEPC